MCPEDKMWKDGRRGTGDGSERRCYFQPSERVFHTMFVLVVRFRQVHETCPEIPLSCLRLGGPQGAGIFYQ